MALPEFFVIGAPKAGTTALHVALARHPRLFMSRVKEPKHFLTDGPPPTGGGPGDAKTFAEYVWRRRDYERLFDAAPAGALRGGARGPDDGAAARPRRPGSLQLDPPVVGRPRAGGRLPARLRPGAPSGCARLGAVLAVPGARPLRRAAAAAVRGGPARAG